MYRTAWKLGSLCSFRLNGEWSLPWVREKEDSGRWWRRRVIDEALALVFWLNSVACRHSRRMKVSKRSPSQIVYRKEGRFSDYRVQQRHNAASVTRKKLVCNIVELSQGSSSNHEGVPTKEGRKGVGIRNFVGCVIKWARRRKCSYQS